MIKRRYHELLLLGSLALFATTFVIFGRADLLRTNLPTFEPARVRMPATAEAEPPDASIEAAVVWSPPASGRTDGWQFRLFTPPAMFRDPTTNTFKLRNASANRSVPAADETAIADDSDSEPHMNEAPRFQLLGHVEREAGAIAGIFQNVQTAEIAVAGSDSPIAGWQTFIERVELEPLHLDPDGLAVRLPRVRAIVRDEQQNRTYVLSADQRGDPLLPGFVAVSETDAALSVAVDSDGER